MADAVVRVSYHLKQNLKKAIKEAKAALKKPLTDDARTEVETLVSNLEAVEMSAARSCGVETWQRRFALTSGVAAVPDGRTTRRAAPRRKAKASSRKGPGRSGR